MTPTKKMNIWNEDFIRVLVIRLISGLYAIYLRSKSHENTHPKPIMVSYHLNIDKYSFTSKNVIAMMLPHIYMIFPTIPNINHKSKNLSLSIIPSSSQCFLN